MISKLRILSFIAVVITLLCCTKQLDESIIDIDDSLVPELNTENGISNLVLTTDSGEEIEVVSQVRGEQNTFVITLPAGTDASDLNLNFTVPDTATILQSTEGIDFSELSIRLFTVVAENGDTNGYAVKVTVLGNQEPVEPDDPIGLSGDFFITNVVSVIDRTNTEITFEDTIDPALNTVEIVVPVSTDISDLGIDFAISEGAVIENPLENEDFTSMRNVFVTVMAEDETTNRYLVTVELEEEEDLSDENLISSVIIKMADVEIPDATATINNDLCLIKIEVPNGTPINALDLDFNIPETATLDAVTTNLDFSVMELKMFTVVAENLEDEKTYTVEVCEEIRTVSIDEQKEALLSMFDETSGANWDFDLPLSEWDRITVNEEGNVIDLTQGRFTGGGIIPIPQFNERIGELIYLERIFATNLIPKLGSLPDEIGNLKSLRSLILNENSIRSLPESIGDLENLTLLDLRANSLTTLPDSFVNLTSLTTLNLQIPNLPSIPQIFCDKAERGELNLIKDDRTICDGDLEPASITAQKQALLNMLDPTFDINWDLDLDLSLWEGVRVNLTTGNVVGFTQNNNVNFQPIKTFDENLGELIYLETLISTNTNLSSIPDEIGNLTSLTILNLSDNSLTSLPEDIGNLSLITNLFLGNNSLNRLPDNIDRLSSLMLLSVENNLLTEIPNNIGELEALTNLSLFSNSIEVIPESIGDLETLTNLSLFNNSIENIPESIGFLTLLTNLDIRENTLLTSIPQSVCDLENSGTTIIKDDTVVCGINIIPGAFVTIWTGTTVTIPINDDFAYNYNIDWEGDGVIDETNVKVETDHTYITQGPHTIQITGDFPAINFGSDSTGDPDAIIDVVQWGTGEWLSMEGAFRNCINAEITAQDSPDLSNVASINVMFLGATLANPNVSNWVTSNITGMRSVFFNATSAEPDVSNWDVSSVTNMASMFNNAISADPDVSNWDTSNVTNMVAMFQNSGITDPDFSNPNNIGSYVPWDISNVTNVNLMFLGVGLSTEVYDQILIDFSSRPHNNDLEFNGGNSTYCDAALARQSLLDDGWIITDDGVAIDCEEVIEPGEAFITTWSSNEVTISINTDFIYNYSVDWDNDGIIDETNIISEVTHTFDTPGNHTIQIIGEFPAINFGFDSTGDRLAIVGLEQWGTNEWLGVRSAFSGCENLIINATDIPDFSNVTDMTIMFSAATLVNPDVSEWDVSNVIFMNTMFGSTNLTNIDVSKWDISSITSMSSIFADTNLSTEVYDQVLLDLSTKQRNEGVRFGGSPMYCNEAARQALMDTGWVINDGGLDPSCSQFTSEIQAQRDALLGMFNGGGPLNWSEDTDMSLWNDIELDANGNVISLMLIDQFEYVKLDNSLSDLVYLEELTYSENSNTFTSFPDVFTGLINLRFLNVEQNLIDILPASTSALINLETIEVTETDIISLPDSLCERVINGSLTIIKSDDRGEVICE